MIFSVNVMYFGSVRYSVVLTLNAHRVCEVAFKVFHFEKLREQSRRHFDKHAVVQSSAKQVRSKWISETVSVVQN